MKPDPPPRRGFSKPNPETAANDIQSSAARTSEEPLVLCVAIRG